MGDQKKCLKCGHIASYSGQAPAACAGCGAIYSKVEAVALGGNAPPRPARQQPIPRAAPAFIDTLRADSLYPNFRVLVRLTTWFFYLLAIGIMLTAFFSSGEVGSARLIAILGAVILVVVITAVKEASLMLADLSDAAVCIARRQEQNVGSDR